jgi:DNA polymerase III subunit gamma/tau
MGQALYRKYRSKSLSEVLGQEHITTTLANALKSGRISHAYLLTGPRGVGKTSIARILAHEINGLPYDDQAHLDIIEIDAASNRRIDEIRDLRDRVSNAPAAAKYKVYIIDEVHMLTREAFNALLKTLEEPPAHVVFILATTESHKLPETIISRTQHYTFRPVPAEQVIAHLKSIAKSEKMAIDDDALALIAQHGEGSFRDSISLLDQAHNTAELITKADIERILGLAPAEQIAALASSLESGDKSGIITVLSGLYGSGYEPASIAAQLSSILRQKVLDGSPDAAQLLALLQQLLDVAAARSPRQLLELLLLRAALGTVAQSAPVQQTPNAPTGHATPAAQSAPNTTSQAQQQPPKTEHIVSAPTSTPPPSPKAAATAKPKETVQAPPQPEPEPAAPSAPVRAVVGPLSDMELGDLWQQTLDEIKKQYNTLYGIARMTKPQFDGTILNLGFKFAFHQKRMNEVKNRKIFADVFSRLYGAPVEITCIVIEHDEASSSAPDVSAVSNIFGGGELLES